MTVATVRACRGRPPHHGEDRSVWFDESCYSVTYLEEEDRTRLELMSDKPGSRVSFTVKGRLPCREFIHRTGEKKRVPVDNPNKPTIQLVWGELNELLESNVHPTFWVLNSIRMIDPAMMRRFDLVLEVPMPSVKERRRMVAKIADTRLSAGFCERLARTEALSPGVMTRAIAVASELETTSSEDLEHRVEEIVNAQLAAVNAGSVKGVRGSCDVYSIDLLQVSADLRSLAEGIARTGSARLCLYGPPGTGKTAWARHLAETLDRPILVKKSSDLLSCWVGGTEANLAAAFREAKREEAVLLIDEADSFLQDRTKSVRSWETTQVNEMLTQIETFDGIFIATTNLIETFDAASLRRFDLKIRFDAMTAPNARRLLAAHLTALGLPAAEEETLCALDAVPSLTPGDFAAVVRRSRLLPLTDAEDFVRRLAEETALKTDVRHRRRPIGF